MSNLVRFDPFAVSKSLFDDDFFAPYEVLFDRLLSRTNPTLSKELGSNFFENGAYPKVDIRETDSEYIVDVELPPGLKKEQVKVEVKDDTLVLKGEKRSEEKKDGKYHVREIKRSSFIRSFVLPPEVVDKSTVKAKYNDGLLEVRVAKVKPLPPPAPEIKLIDIE